MLLDSTLTLAYFVIHVIVFTQLAIGGGGILYTMTPSSPAATVGHHCYGNCHITGHSLSMSYQISKWPVICQVSGKML